MIITECGVPRLQFICSYNIVDTIFGQSNDADFCMRQFDRLMLRLPHLIKMLLYHCLILGYFNGVKTTLSYQHFNGEYSDMFVGYLKKVRDELKAEHDPRKCPTRKSVSFLIRTPRHIWLAERPKWLRDNLEAYNALCLCLSDEFMVYNRQLQHFNVLNTNPPIYRKWFGYYLYSLETFVTYRNYDTDYNDDANTIMRLRRHAGS